MPYTLGRQVVTEDRTFTGGSGGLISYEELAIPSGKVVVGAGGLLWRVNAQPYPNDVRWSAWASRFRLANGPSDDTAKWWFSTVIEDAGFGDQLLYRLYLVVVNP